MRQLVHLSLALVLLGLTGQASALPIITLAPQVEKIHPGDNLFVDVNVSGLGNTPLGAFSMDVLFSPALNFLPSASGANTFGSALGDVNAGEAEVGADPWVPGSGKFSFYEVSLLDSATLDALQGDDFRLATLAFNLPYVNTLPTGASIFLSTSNVVLSDDLGNQLITGNNPGAIVKVTEPSVFLLLGLGLIVSFFSRKTSGLNWREQ